ALLLTFVAASAYAHHSITSEYDATVLIELAGTIAAVEIVNPHVRITLQSGQGQWLVEMAAPNALLRRGVDPKALLTVGRQVTVEVFPALDGSLRVNGRTLTADGRRFDVGDGFGW